jgi:thiamine kinase-like enzyme
MSGQRADRRGAGGRLDRLAARVRGLECWRGPVTVEPLKGGITNVNFVVRQGGDRFVVRLGDDVPVHQILRANERAASLAAHKAGVSPEVVHFEDGILVLRFIDGATLTPESVRNPANLTRLVALVRRCHDEMPLHLRGPASAFWPFHVIRDYARAIRAAVSPWVPRLDELLAEAARLERALGPARTVFGHNDLLPANVIDDGKRLWLIDWDYAGFGSPLFDLANLASNAECGLPEEKLILESYFGAEPDAAMWRSFRVMGCASLLREAMWGMVSAIDPPIAFDYHAYAGGYLGRFQRALAALPA